MTRQRSFDALGGMTVPTDRDCEARKPGATGDMAASIANNQGTTRMPDSIDSIAATVVLDKMALAALRMANTVSFHHTDGKSTIRASKLLKTELNPFAPREASVTVPCNARISDYERGAKQGTEVYGEGLESYTAFAWQSLDDPWQTIASSLKVGDELTLHWLRGGFSTVAMKSADLHCDALYLRIRRGNKRLTFLVEFYCGENTNRRMVRHRPRLDAWVDCGEPGNLSENITRPDETT